MMKLRNMSGFSLIEILIAMGLATGLLIFLMKMQGESAKNAKTAQVNQAVETFFNDFKATLDRPGYCIKSFENVSLSENSLQSIQAIKNPRGEVRYAVGEIYGNYVKLNAIAIKDFKPDDNEGLEGIADIELVLERIGKIYGAKIVKKTMEVSVSRDKSNKILDCGALGSTNSLKVNIEAPAETTTPNQNQNQNPNTNSDSNSSSTTTSGITTTTATSTTTTSPPSSNSAPAPTDEARAQEAMMRELQNNPQLKQIQESIKAMQKQNASGGGGGIEGIDD